MLEPRDLLPFVSAAQAAAAEVWEAPGVTIRRIAGGANNALFQLQVEGQCYACKVFVPDERRRAVREYGTLRLLRAAGLDVAPEPLLLDESCTILPLPVVIYRWIEGRPLGPAVASGQLSALLACYQAVVHLRQGDFADAELPTAWFHWFDRQPYLAELDDWLDRYGSWLAATDVQGAVLHARLARLVASNREFFRGTSVAVSRGQFPLRLCHVDTNLANAIWCPDGRVRWVDWEYSGWGDPALNLAELRWHGSTAALNAAQQGWLRQNYCRPADDPSFEDRLVLWDRLLATRWPFLVLRMYWSHFHGPDRVRLSLPTADPGELRARIIRFIERAERLAAEQ